MNDSAFFAEVRKHFGSLKQPQVEGFNALLTALADWPVTWIAYALATAWHETAKTMQPIKERGGDAYFKRMYDPQGERPAVAQALGNWKPGDGIRFAGRGYVQLTGRKNYERYGLAEKPDDAMKTDVAAGILRQGMEGGVFTGRSLKNFLPIEGGGDYVAARRIINGRDKAEDIAAYAEKFEASLRKAG